MNSNYKTGHDFESAIAKILNEHGILSYGVKVRQGDGGVDIIANYEKKIIIIQCKSIESSILLKYVKDFEATLSKFPDDSLGIIVYDSDRMKSPNLLTKQAATWMKTMEKNLVISNEKCLVSDIKKYFNQTNTINDPSNLIKFKKLNASSLDMFGMKAENVNIESILIKKKPRFHPY